MAHCCGALISRIIAFFLLPSVNTRYSFFYILVENSQWAEPSPLFVICHLAVPINFVANGKIQLVRAGFEPGTFGISRELCHYTTLARQKESRMGMKTSMVYSAFLN